MAAFDKLTKNGIVRSRGLEAAVIGGLCSAVDHLHAKKIVHLDIKPRNVFLSEMHGPAPQPTCNMSVANRTSRRSSAALSF